MLPLSGFCFLRPGDRPPLGIAAEPSWELG
jgi:hypothetical protein